mgnify:CR=1 FL=1
MIISRVLGALFRPYWRLVRGMTLGAQGVVIDGEGRVLLVRHAYRPGWHFPGGGVEWHETIETALRRELAEETGVEVGAAPELVGLYANFDAFPGDHIALFIVRVWTRPRRPSPNAEIAETGFFTADALPAATAAGTRRRIAEISGGAARADRW